MTKYGQHITWTEDLLESLCEEVAASVPELPELLRLLHLRRQLEYPAGQALLHTISVSIT